MTSQTTRTRFTLFLASPSKDTGPAREAVVQAVQALTKETAFAQTLEIRLFRWDDPHRPVVLSLHEGGQPDVIEQMAHPAEVDLLIGLFCHTLGGTLAPDQRCSTRGKPFGYADEAAQRPWHCTEWEVAQARQALVFFDERQPSSREARKTVGAVEALRERLQTQGKFSNDYRDEDDLRTKLTDVLRQRLEAALAQHVETAAATAAPANVTEPPLDAAHAALLKHLLTPPQDETERLPPVPDAMRDAALNQPARCLRSWLLLRYAQGCTEQADLLDRKFVALTVTIPQAEGPAASVSYDDLGAALEKPCDAPAWVLIGPPGAGKTTLLRHLEMRCALAALRALAEHPNATPPLAMLWRLGDYHATESPEPAVWLAKAWGLSCPQGPSWETLSQRFPIRLLLDGANEMPAPDTATHEAALRRWAAWVHRLRACGPVAPLLSVRRHELALLQAADLADLRQISVQPWADARIQQYCEQRQQQPLWQHLRRQPRLLDMARNPFNLKHQCEVGQQLKRPAEHRAELLAALLHLRLRTPANRPKLAAPGVLGADWRTALAPEWPDAPLCLPDDAGLLHALAQGAAQQMHDGAGQSWPESRWAAQWQQVGGAAGALQAALEAAQALDVLRCTGRVVNPLSPTRAERQWRWSHQLWQEFFAARALRDAVAGVGRLPADLATPQPEPLDWVTRETSWEPLPGPGVNAWDECVQLALAQSDHPLLWLEVLQAQGNLALAGRAAVLDAQRLHRLPGGAAALAALQTRLRQRSEDETVDLRQRIEAAELAHELGDERYEIHRDAQGRELWRRPRPERWITVPAGEYTLGSADELSHERGPDGQPLRLHLNAFQIAFAPVTNAEFRCFVEAGGYEDERWWPGEANAWRLGRMDNAAGRDLFIQTVTQNAEAIVNAPNLSPEFKEPLQAAIQEGPEAVATFARKRALAAYPPPQENPQPFQQPLFWADPRFNHPAQPVVGVCWYEAQAYALWLSQATRQPHRLPTEAEWEASARGPTARRWLWATDETPERHQLNSFEAGVRRTTPVGLFPTSHTPQGTADLAGNVWEWTASAYTDSLQAETMHATADGSAPRAVRGGGWDFPASNARAGFRDRLEPVFRNVSLGFRVVVCCPLNF